MTVELEAIQRQLIIVTGYSGAGKSTVLKVLEDSGFFCVDNLPISLMNSLVHSIVDGTFISHRVALVLDVRSGYNISDLIKQLTKEYTNKIRIQVVFLIADTYNLIKRYQETRRNHPLARSISLDKAIDLEKELLEPLRQEAHVVVSTDQMTVLQLRKLVRLSLLRDPQDSLLVQLISFGFKFGAPRECNFVFDVRSLPNPYFDTDLRCLDGRDEKIQDYIFSHQEARDFFKQFNSFLEYSLECLYKESRYFATVAIGCTGGQHRSVALVHLCTQKQISNVVFIPYHRDLAKNNSPIKK